MDTKRWIIFGVIVVAIMGGLVYMAQGNKIDVSNVDESKVIDSSDNNGQIGDHVLGKKDSPVILIEYGDFQCPGCGAAEPNVKQLVDEYKDKIAFVYRHLPLTSIHPNARVAAAAAEAAGKQGKFWEMHDIIFSNQDSWKNLGANERTEAFTTYATQAGIADIEMFKADMANENINRKISFDQALAKKMNATGTPAFTFNGNLLDNEITNGITQGDTTKLRELLDAELKKHNIAPPATKE